MQKNDSNQTAHLLELSAAFLGGLATLWFYHKLTSKQKSANQDREGAALEDNHEDEESSELSEEGELSDYEDEEEDEQEERKKIVLVARTDLKMGTGKVAAQCSHATLGLYREIVRHYRNKRSNLAKRNMGWLKYWNESGCAKIAVKCPSLEEMQQIRDQVKKAQLPHYVVIDAGKTQVAAYTATVLAVFGPESEVNKYTGGLKLL